MIVKRIDSLKRSVTLIPECGLDLLNIFRVVEFGDLIHSETSREVKKERVSGKIDSERVRVVLGVEVEDKRVDPLMRRISFMGRIVYESKPLDLLGKHHTIHLYPGIQIRISSPKNFDKLKAFASSYVEKRRPGKVLCISMDDERIAVAEFSSTGLKNIYSRRLSSIDKSISWVRRDTETVFGEVLKVVKGYLSEHRGREIILMGPRIFVEDFLNFLKKTEKPLLKKIRRIYYSSVGGVEGMREALRSGILRDLPLKPVRDSLEVERFIKLMASSPEKVAVGLREVLKAWRLGAVEKVLVSEKYLWNNMTDENLGSLLDAAERGKLDLQVLLDGLEASEKIMGFGGLAAFLRYPLPLKDIPG